MLKAASQKAVAGLLSHGIMERAVKLVAQDRKQSSLDGFWATLTPEQIGAVEAVAMDM